MNKYDLTDVRVDALRMYGNFGFKAYRDGKLLLAVRKKNQITNEGRAAVLNLLVPYTFSEDQSDNRIWSFSVGTRTTPASLTDDAASFAPGLATTVWTSAFDFAGGECVAVASPPNDYRIQITKTLPATSSADGETISEAGIFTRGDDDDPTVAAGRKLYARQVHSPIIKTDGMVIEYDWELGLLVQTSA
jgi:hypothetical protein